MKRFLVFVTVIVGFVAVVAFSQWNPELLTNPRFEGSAIPEGVLVRTNALPGWTVEGGTVLVFRSGDHASVIWDRPSGVLSTICNRRLSQTRRYQCKMTWAWYRTFPGVPYKVQTMAVPYTPEHTDNNNAKSYQKFFPRFDEMVREGYTIELRSASLREE